MARQVTSGSPSAFTTVAKVSDNTDENISYQWQIDGVDLVDGTAVPTKSEISSFFYSPTVRNASDRFSLPGDYEFISLFVTFLVFLFFFFLLAASILRYSSSKAC